MHYLNLLASVEFGGGGGFGGPHAEGSHLEPSLEGLEGLGPACQSSVF